LRLDVAGEFKRFDTEVTEERRRTQRKITAFTEGTEKPAANACPVR
jgi:hypothetical protein